MHHITDGKYSVSSTPRLGAVFRQLDFMKGRALGFDRHQKLILPIKSNLNSFRRNYEAIKSDFKSHVTITGAAVSSTVPGPRSWRMTR